MDFAIARFFNHLGQGTFIDTLSIIISYNGGYISVLVLLGLLALWRDRINGKKVFLAIIIAMALHFSISDGFFKKVIPHYFGAKERPYMAHPQEIMPLGKLNTSSSLPSNHMSSVVAVLGVLIYYYRKYWKYAAIFVMLMAFSRMHNGMHYPSDVIAGTLFGLIYSQLAVYIVNKNILNINKLV